MPDGKASARRTLLNLRTGPGNTSQGSVEMKSSAPGAEKSGMPGRDV